MFIRPIGRNNLQELSSSKYIPDLIFESEKDFINYIVTQEKVKFSHPSFFGLMEKEEVGFVSSKKIKVESQEFLSNCIFVLDEKKEKIKNTYSANFAHNLIKVNVVDNIATIREKSLQTNNHSKNKPE